MNEIFDIKRTKMTDEAALGHKPMGWGKSLLIFLLVLFAASVVQGMISGFPTGIYIATSPAFKDALSQYADGSISLEQLMETVGAISPKWLEILSLFSTFGMILTAVLYCKLFEKRKISSMGIRKDGAVPEYLTGLVIGFVMFGISIAFCVATGSAKINTGNNINVIYIILYFIGFLIQGASEEMLCRGYFMTSLSRDYAPAVAISISSVVFALLHWGNDGFGILPFINILLFGAFLGIYIFKRGSIWGACAIHSMWNFVPGNVFGTSVSGGGIMSSLFSTTFKNNRDIITGGNFGPEGGLCVTAVLVISICIALFVLKTKKSELSYTEMTSDKE